LVKDVNAVNFQKQNYHYQQQGQRGIDKTTKNTQPQQSNLYRQYRRAQNNNGYRQNNKIKKNL
jgi:hypothetical protein